MARLPRFQESGLVSSDVQRLDLANIKEERGASMALSESLDKISQFAFGEAIKEKKEADRLLGIQLRADYESEIQKRVNELDIMVETGRLADFNTIQTEVQSLQGYARTLAQIDTEQASGLMRSISTSGNALLKKSSDILVKAYGAQVDAKTDETISSLKSNLDALYQYESDPDRIKEYEAGARSIAFALASQNPSSLPAKMKEFDQARITARDNALTKYFASTEFATSPVERLDKLRGNNGGKMTTIWSSLDEESKNKVIDRINKRISDEYALLDREEKLTAQRNSVADTEDYDSYVLGDISGDQLITRMRSRGTMPSREFINSVRSGDHSGATLQLMGSLESQARRGQLSDGQIDDFAKRRSISWKQANELKNIVNGSERSDMAQAKQFINNSFVPNPLDPTTRAGNQRAADVKNQLLEEFNAAQRAGKPFDAFARAQELVGNRQKQEDMQALADTRRRLGDKLSEYGLQYREDYTVDDLKRTGKVNDQQIKIIRRLIQGIDELK